MLIKNEFESRGLLDKFNAIVESKVRVIPRCQEALAQHEAVRFEKELDAVLAEFGVVCFERFKVGAKILMIKEKMEENGTEERDWSVYEIDRQRYFKQQSVTYDIIALL
mmetsp:Transcript_21469/g.43617  ORF Transcript_21469/g.43617 Transcript_21469/m.43617 type:complete len:109 (-) Transcript_21469:8-334(-)